MGTVDTDTFPLLSSHMLLVLPHPRFFFSSLIHGCVVPTGALCKIAVVRLGTFSFGGLVVGQFITDQNEQSLLEEVWWV